MAQERQRCHEVFREKASGKEIKHRPQLERAINELGTGDCLLIAEWDRVTRSMSRPWRLGKQ
jgi:DNA invertase Pin-like site-specific DNA recombinase